MDRRIQKLNLFAAFAEQLATLSCCKVAKHGCVIVPEDFSAILAIGYNGPPRGMPNDSCTSKDGSMCGCAHAESNAIGKLGRQGPCILICTKSPCATCAAAIINNGSVEIIVYSKPWSKIVSTYVLFRTAGITMLPLDQVSSI